jgi:hypothetical protein
MTDLGGQMGLENVIGSGDAKHLSAGSFAPLQPSGSQQISRWARAPARDRVGCTATISICGIEG